LLAWAIIDVTLPLSDNLGRLRSSDMWGYIQKFPDWVDNEINNKNSLRSNTKGYGGKTH
jgi:hypothetical protein